MESNTSTLESLSTDVAAFVAGHTARQTEAREAAKKAGAAFEAEPLPEFRRFVEGEGVGVEHPAVVAAIGKHKLGVECLAVTEQGAELRFWKA